MMMILCSSSWYRSAMTHRQNIHKDGGKGASVGCSRYGATGQRVTEQISAQYVDLVKIVDWRDPWDLATVRMKSLVS